MSKHIFGQIVNGLDYCHNIMRIAHRDLKPQNILLDDDWNIKIADFGLCKMMDTIENNYITNEDEDDLKLQSQQGQSYFIPTHCGTRGYIAPEMFFKKQSAIYLSSEKERFCCDIFSLGIILWKMLMGVDSRPFEIFEFSEDSRKKWYKYKLIEERKYDSWWNHFKNDIIYHYDHDLKDLFVSMYVSIPKERITVKGIMNHTWYKKIEGYNGLSHQYNPYNDYFSHKMSIMYRKIVINSNRNDTSKSETLTNVCFQY